MSVKNYLKDKTQNVKPFRLFTFRALMITVSCMIAYLTDKVEVVINLGGALVIPIISFYLPMLVVRTHAIVYNIKRSIFWKLHDACIVLLGVGVQFFALKYSIEYQILNKD